MQTPFARRHALMGCTLHPLQVTIGGEQRRSVAPPPTNDTTNVASRAWFSFIFCASPSVNKMQTKPKGNRNKTQTKQNETTRHTAVKTVFSAEQFPSVVVPHVHLYAGWRVAMEVRLHHVRCRVRRCIWGHWGPGASDELRALFRRRSWGALNDIVPDWSR